MNPSNEDVIIGIDPGTRTTGYGIIRISKGTIEPIDYGTISPPTRELLSTRYTIIFDSIFTLIATHHANVMAIETPFVHKNVQSALKLGTAQGSAILAAKKNGLRVYGFSPRSVKCRIAGTGKASKLQLQLTLQRLLRLKNLPTPSDAADALAIAITYAQVSQNRIFCHQQYEL